MTAGTVDDVVFLHPYYSAADPALPSTRWSVPLEHAPRYLRTKSMSRWHRPRYGFRYVGGPWKGAGRESVVLWCGMGITDLRKALSRGDAPPEDEVCGTCEGRALGAGQDPTPPGMPALIFRGRTGAAPKRCPGSRSADLAVTMPGGRCATCRVCHDVVPLRLFGGGPWRDRLGLGDHPPGDALVPPCQHHGWHHLEPVGAIGAACRCVGGAAVST